MSLLILGGTGEARELAARLAARPDVRFVSSLAGRVREPALPKGPVRIGGFGGVTGLRQYLRDEGVTAVVDATHPFAESISDHAAAACRAERVPLVVLRRPGWPDGGWHRVPAIGDVPRALDQLAPTGIVLLTTGRRDLAVFAPDARRHYVIRVVDEPDGPVPPNSTVIRARGPYTVDGEMALMAEHHVTALVTKDSGGPMTSAKLTAAAKLCLPVIVVDRPPVPAGVTVVPDVARALAWLAEQQVAEVGAG